MTIKLTFEFENIQQATEFLIVCASLPAPRAITERAPQNETYGRSPLVSELLPAAKELNEVLRPRAESAAPAEAVGPSLTVGVDSTPVAAPKRRSRKLKATTVTFEAAPPAGQSLPITAEAPSVASAKEAGAAAVTTITVDDAIGALKVVSEAKGMPVCFDILKRHGAARVSEVLPQSRARFIQDCRDVVAGKDIAAAA